MTVSRIERWHWVRASPCLPGHHHLRYHHLRNKRENYTKTQTETGERESFCKHIFILLITSAGCRQLLEIKLRVNITYYTHTHTQSCEAKGRVGRNCDQLAEGQTQLISILISIRDQTDSHLRLPSTPKHHNDSCLFPNHLPLLGPTATRSYPWRDGSLQSSLTTSPSRQMEITCIVVRAGKNICEIRKMYFRVESVNDFYIFNFWKLVDAYHMWDNKYVVLINQWESNIYLCDTGLTNGKKRNLLIYVATLWAL